MFNQRAFIAILRLENGLRGEYATIMALWTLGYKYKHIARKIRGMTVGKVAGVINRYRTDGYVGSKKSYVSSRGPTRTGPLAHDIRSLSKNGRMKRHALTLRGFDTYALLKNAFEEKDDDTG